LSNFTFYNLKPAVYAGDGAVDGVLGGCNRVVDCPYGCVQHSEYISKVICDVAVAPKTCFPIIGQIAKVQILYCLPSVF
jgi:hypothetical protein